LNKSHLIRPHLQQLPNMSKVQLTIVQEQSVGFSTDVFLSLANEVVSDQVVTESTLLLSLVFVGDEKMQTLNKTYRNKDGSTDVLSFPYITDYTKPIQEGSELGEIIISVTKLQEQASEFKHDNLSEAKILFIHGLLHILGYDHLTDEDRLKMNKNERKYLGDNLGLVERTQS